MLGELKHAKDGKFRVLDIFCKTVALNWKFCNHVKGNVSDYLPNPNNCDSGRVSSTEPQNI